MKAILVIDAEPMNCDDCPFQTKNQFCMAWVYKIDSNSVDYTDDIANGCYCPLKEMPLKSVWDNDFSDGWNACIDVITGETE